VFCRSRPEIEVQAVRTLGVTLLCVCIALAGCSSTRNKRSDTARASDTNTPFMGTPTTPSSPASSGSSETKAPLVSSGPSKPGVLAGQVLDEFNRRRPGAIVQVVDLDAPRDSGAPISVKTDKEGYFDVGGLEGGHSYRLAASVREGARILTGTQRAVPPNVRVAIYLTGERPATETPADKADKAPGPAASLGSPIKGPDSTKPPPGEGSRVASGGPPPPDGRDGSLISGGVTTPLPPSDAGRAAGAGSTPGLPPPVSTNDPSLIADKGNKDVQDGFTRGVPAAIEGPGRDHVPEKPKTPPYTPPPPPETGTTTPLPASTAPSAVLPLQGIVDPVPEAAAPRVPSCVMNGTRLDNFALYDFDGKVWEYRRERKSKLVLLDFWFSNCGPCRLAIPHLVDLQKKYGAFGLQVVGIAYEDGSLADKQKAVRPVKGRSGINYPLLFGEMETCPVLRQFNPGKRFPTLVLLDSSGTIVYRTSEQGLTAQAAYDMEMEIRRQLGLPLR
jgi:thiol-disulfide isomerase/thioredoxin